MAGGEPQQRRSMSTVEQAPLSTAQTAAITRRELLIWLFAAAVLVIALRYFQIGNAALFWKALDQINVFVCGALCVAGWRLQRYASPAPATSRDVMVVLLLLVLLCAMALAPHLLGVGVFLCLFVLYLVRLDDPSGELRASAVVLMSLATNFLLAPVVFRLFLPLFIRLDAFLIGNVLRLLDGSIEWRGSTFEHMEGAQRFGVTLIGACSSFNNVSAAVMVHMAWAMALRKHLTYFDGLAVLFTIALATALNVGRVSLSALGPDGYAFWHGNGTGVPTGALIFIVVQNIAMVLAGYATARWASRAGTD
jgi:hypothetical protein